MIALILLFVFGPYVILRLLWGRDDPADINRGDWEIDNVRWPDAHR